MNSNLLLKLILIIILSCLILALNSCNSNNQSSSIDKQDSSIATPKKPEWDPNYFKIIEGIVLEVEEGIEIDGHCYTKIVYQDKWDPDPPGHKNTVHIEGLPSGQTFYLNQENKVIYCYDIGPKFTLNPLERKTLGVKKVELIEQ